MLSCNITWNISISSLATAANTFSSSKNYDKMCHFYYFRLHLKNMTWCWSHFSFWKQNISPYLGTLYTHGFKMIYRYFDDFKQLINFRKHIVKKTAPFSTLKNRLTNAIKKTISDTVNTKLNKNAWFSLLSIVSY